jgi:hypothetical protein
VAATRVKLAALRQDTVALRSTAQRKTADLSAVPATAIVLGIALAILPISVRAETKVRGTPQAVVVEVQNASVEEVLVALTDIHKVRFRSAANLDKRVTGTYQGTLRQAVSQILKGYHFVVTSGRAGLEITLLGTGKPLVVVGARPATKAAEAVAAATQSTPTATVDNHPVPVPSSGGPTPPISFARGPPPVPTPPTAGVALGPVPQIGPGPEPTPMPTQPGGAPRPVPPLPTASPAAPPTPPAPAPNPTRPMWVAQLIGDSSETAALSRFRQMQRKLRSALGSYEAVILRTTIKDGTTWIRVRVGTKPPKPCAPN